MLRLLGLLLACVLVSSEARAHAVLLDTTPPDGAALAAAPAEVVLRFNETVAPVAVRVIDAAGRDIATAAARAQNQEIRLDLPGLLPGGYVVSWRMVSADSHPIGGAFVFGIGEGAPAAAAPDNAGREVAWTFALVITRAVLYAALLYAAGSALFGALVLQPLRIEPRFARTARRSAIVVAAFAALLAIGLKGGQLAAGAPLALFDARTWALGLSTSVARSTLVIDMGLLLLLSGSLPTQPVGAVIALGGLGFTGHAAASGVLGQFLVSAHALCAAFWLGAFVPLLRLMPAHPAAALAAARRFSGLAIPMLLILAGTGVAMALLRIPSTDDLTGSLYGQMLLFKLLLVVTLLAVAAVNRWRTTPALLARRRGAEAALTRQVRIEIALGAVVLILTAVLAHTPPPAMAVHDHAEPGYAVLASQGQRQLLLEVSPARAGANRVTARLMGPEPQEISASFALPERGIEAITRPLTKATDGSFQLERFDLPLAGAWQARVEVLIDDFTKTTFETEITLR